MTDYDIEFWQRQSGAEFFSAYQRPDLQENSCDLVRAMQEHLTNLPKFAACHEMGAGMGRNLQYIHQTFPDWQLTANDVNPSAPVEMWRVYPDLPVIAYDILPSQHWVKLLAQQHVQVDVILSSDHFIHVEDMTPFRFYLPQVVGRYLVLRESAGNNKPDSDYYWHWTATRQAQGQSRWFDRDYAKLFEGTSLKLVHRKRQRSYFDPRPRWKWCVKNYDLYVFEQERE